MLLGTELREEREHRVEGNLGRVFPPCWTQILTESDIWGYLAKTLLIWDEGSEDWLFPKHSRIPNLKSQLGKQLPKTCYLIRYNFNKKTQTKNWLERKEVPLYIHSNSTHLSQPSSNTISSNEIPLISPAACPLFFSEIGQSLPVTPLPCFLFTQLCVIADKLWTPVKKVPCLIQVSNLVKCLAQCKELNKYLLSGWYKGMNGENV